MPAVFDVVSDSEIDVYLPPRRMSQGRCSRRDDISTERNYASVAWFECRHEQATCKSSPRSRYFRTLQFCFIHRRIGPASPRRQDVT